jgi:TPR repeat protein
MRVKTLSLAVLMALAMPVVAGEASQTPVPDLITKAQAGDVKAQRALGQFYLDDADNPKAIKAGVAWLDAAGDAGDPTADYLLALYYQRQPESYANTQRLLSHLRRAALHGHTTAQAMLGERLVDRSQSPELSADQRQEFADKGKSLLEFAANASNAYAERALAQRLLQGQGIRRDPAAAKKWLARASSEGDALASVQLAHLAFAENEPARAMQALTIAAQDQFPAAVKEITERYEYGRGVTQDLDRAKYWSGIGVTIGLADGAAVAQRVETKWIRAHTPKIDVSTVLDPPRIARIVPEPRQALGVLPVDDPPTVMLVDAEAVARQIAQTRQRIADQTQRIEALKAQIAQAQQTIRDLTQSNQRLVATLDDSVPDAPVRQSTSPKTHVGAKHRNDVSRPPVKHTVALKASKPASSPAAPVRAEPIVLPDADTMATLAEPAPPPHKQDPAKLNRQGLERLHSGQPALAAKLLEQAADLGYAIAQNNLGMLYLMGNGVDANTQRAIELFRKAAFAGNPNAAINLGFVYQHGRGVAPDMKQAQRWYTMAMQHGSNKARSYLRQLQAAADLAATK